MKYLLFILLTSCAGPISELTAVETKMSPVPVYKRQWDGHRICGDHYGVKENRLENITYCKKFEKLSSFKRWEFDVNSAKDGLVIVHNSKHGNFKIRKFTRKAWGYPKYEDFVKALIAVKPVRKVWVDLKVIKSSHHEKLVKEYEKFIDAGVNAVFATSCARKNNDTTKWLIERGYPVDFYHCD